MLKPRWLGLLAALVVLLVAFTFLGLWQLSVARDDAEREALATAQQQAPVPLGLVLVPHGPFPADASGRPVTMTGSYDPALQVLVADRRLEGTTGYWVVTPLSVDATATGGSARIAVLRGFVTTANGTGPPPSTIGPVTVTGTLAPGESPASAGPARPDGQLGSLDLARLVNRWPGDLYNAFVFATSESPDASAGLQRVPPPPLPTGLTWRNAAYALQWWVFGLFAAYMWWRMVRDDHRRDQSAADTPNQPAGATT
jgi:cytochrome oxidase assembly protein ShyY1